MVLHDLRTTATESSTGGQGVRHRADQHLDVIRIDILMLGETTSGASEKTKGVRFVEDKTVFVFVLQSDDFREVGHVAGGFEEAFGDDEAAGEGFAGLFARDFLEHAFEVGHVVVRKPFNRAAGDLDALLNCKVAGAVGDDDVPALGERGNDRGDGGEALRVDDACGKAEEPGDLELGGNVDVLGTVEVRGPACTDAVGTQDGDRAFFDQLRRGEVEVVVSAEVEEGPGGGGEFDFWPGGTGDDGAVVFFEGFEGCGGGDEGFGSPFFYKLVDFLHKRCKTQKCERGGKGRYFFGELGGLDLRGVARREEVAHSEEEEAQLDDRADRVVLVGVADVADDDGGAGKLPEVHGDVVHGGADQLHGVVEIHGGGDNRKNRFLARRRDDETVEYWKMVDQWRDVQTAGERCS